MALQNVLGDLALDATLQEILAELLTADVASGQDTDNAATPALAASAVWTGNFKEVDHHGSLIYLYAILNAQAPASVVIEYSNDGSTVISTSNIAKATFDAAPGVTYAIYLLIANGVYGGKYARPKVTNTATAQTSTPIAVFARNKFPFSGSFGALNSSLTFFSQALLTRAVLAGQDPANGFNNVGADKQGNLFVQDRRATLSQSGSQFFEGIRDDVSVVFSRDRGAAAVAALVSGGGGSVAPTHDPTEGQAVFATSVAPGEICFYLSQHTVNYEPGHMIRLGQTIQIPTQPTGDGKILWGLGESNGTGNLINAIGYEYAADGLFAVRIKNGAYVTRRAQSTWNRDTVSGQTGSQYTVNGLPVAIDPSKNNIYEKQFEWYGAAPPTSLLASPYGQPIIVDVEETVGQIFGTTVPEANMRLFVRIRGDHTTGQALTVRTGSWRGGILTNKTVLTGVDPNGVYGDLGVQGRHLANCTIIPLNGNTGGTDHIWRGQWFGWQGSYVGAIIDSIADVPGTVHIDFSAHPVPVDGDDSSVDQPSISYDYDPSEGLFRRTIPVQSRWMRVRFVNGTTAQAVFSVDTAFLTAANVQGMHPFRVMPALSNLAAMTQSEQLVLAAEDQTQLTPLTGTATGARRALDVQVAAVETPVAQKAPTGFSTGQGLVLSTAALPYPPVPSANRLAVKFTNMDPKIPMLYADSPAKLTGQGAIVFPYGQEPMDLDPGAQVYWRIEDQGGASTTSTVSAASTQNNVGVVGPNNALVSDDSRAVLDALTDSFELTGFVGARTHAQVGSVVLQCEGRRSATPVTETAGYTDVTTGTALNVASVVSGSVPLSATHQYLVAISRRNTAAVVTSVTGMGTTWTQVPGMDATGGVSRISLWQPVTQPTAAGPVTANFSALATASVISVARFPSVDLTNPFTATVVQQSLTNTGTYAGTINAVGQGMAVTFASMRERTHTAGSGFTEQIETRTGATATDASLAVSTLAESVTGAQAYSGTFSGNVGWSLIAVTLNPRPAVTPALRIRYKVGAESYGMTELAPVFSSAVDALFEADITVDRSWTFADIDAVTVHVDVSAISVTGAEVDRVGLKETDIDAGNSAKLCWVEVRGT